MAYAQPGWGTGGNDLHAQRMQQIGSLRSTFHQNLRVITPQTVFEVPVTLSNGASAHLGVTLPEQFPYVPPVLQLNPAVPISCLDSRGVVIASAHDKLRNWSVQYSLGKLVLDIVNGPLLRAPVNPQFGGGANVPHSGPGSLHPPASRRQEQEVDVPIPPIPASFPELDHKSADELRLLLEDDDAFEVFIQDLDFVKTLVKLRNDIRDNNAELAQKNLSREQEVKDLRNDVDGKKSQLESLKNVLNEKVELQRQMMAKYSPAILLQRLQEAAQEIDQDSERTSKQFLEGEMNHKVFLDTYMEQRVLYHLRSAKLEQIQRTGVH